MTTDTHTQALEALRMLADWADANVTDPALNGPLGYARAALAAAEAQPMAEPVAGVAEPLPGWKLNHARRHPDPDQDGAWEIGFLDDEDNRFSPIITVDTGLYFQDEHAEPLARAILSRLIASPVAAEAQPDHIPDAGKMVAQPVAVPQGWKLVPVEPTEEMGIAGGIAWDTSAAHDVIGPLVDAWAAMLAAAPAAPAPAHPDDQAVERFASMLKAKLAKARAKGRAGWSNPAWPAADINRQLHEHAAKGDPLDVAAYAMFLALRGEASTAASAPAPVSAAIWQWLTSDGGSICERWQTILERWDGSDGRAGLEAAAVAAMRAHGIGGKV